MAHTPAATASHSPHSNPNLSQFPPPSLGNPTFGTHWTSTGALRADEPDSSSSLHPTYALLSTPSNLQNDSTQFFHKLPPDHQLNPPPGSSNSNVTSYFPAMDTGGEYYSPQPSSSSSAFNQMPSNQANQQQSSSRQMTDLDGSMSTPSRSTGGVSLPGFTSPESAFYQYQNRMEGQLCQICGELAAGFHHGAYVCEACKKFFMRHSLANGRSTTTCPSGGNCVIVKNSRGRCQQCRYKKCLEVGMSLKDMDAQGELDISNIPCRVCGGRSSGFHFGALTCEGCKGFFRRTEETASRLVCVGGKDNCTITPRSRNVCKSCRFRRCLRAGMSKRGSRIGRQPNAVKFHCAIEIRQMQDNGQPLASDFGHPPRKHSSVPTLTSSSASPSSSSQTNGTHGGGMGDLPQRRASAGACDMAAYSIVTSLPRRKASAPVKMESVGLHLVTASRPGSVQTPISISSIGGGGGSSQISSSTSSAAAAAAAAAAATAAVSGVVGTDEEILVDGLNWFNYGMRMAIEFMRLPATYFKSRFDMSTVEPSQADDEHQVWDHVMNHFHLHSQQVVQFAKLIPGFNQMSLSARGHLVRASLYSEVLLMLSRDYDVTEDRYNFLDFSPAERDIILRHFPIYNRVVEHLKISGRFFQQLNLTHTEFVYACAIGILRQYYILANPAYTDARKLLLLARHSLLATMRSQTESQ
ncbi:unnamed protein product, partial [Hymenolepis diminuta]